MLVDLRHAKVFGHPIHMMLLHFPAALLPLATIYDLLRMWNVVPDRVDITYILWPGVVLGWMAALFGLWDLAQLKPASKEMMVAMIHGGINATSLSLFSWALFRYATVSVPSALSLAIEIAGTVLMLVGNKYGGDLVLTLGVATHTDLSDKT